MQHCCMCFEWVSCLWQKCVLCVCGGGYIITYVSCFLLRFVLVCVCLSVCVIVFLPQWDKVRRWPLGLWHLWMYRETDVVISSVQSRWGTELSFGWGPIQHSAVLFIISTLSSARMISALEKYGCITACFCRMGFCLKMVLECNFYSSPVLKYKSEVLETALFTPLNVWQL